MPELTTILRRAINPALRLLPHEMVSDEARQLMLTIGLQESGFETREQYGGGPARSYWQFELGTEASHGGIWGIYLHPASGPSLEYVCSRRDVAFDPDEIYDAMLSDDILGAACARLLMWTDPYAIPTEPEPAWHMYADRTWRPGKPRPDDWPGNYVQASQVMADWDGVDHLPNVDLARLARLRCLGAMLRDDPTRTIRVAPFPNPSRTGATGKPR